VRLVSDHTAVLQRYVCQVQLQPDDAWPMDPGRRADGRRVTQLSFLAPRRLSRLVTSFEVIEEPPFDMRRVKVMLRLRSIGQLEIKQRGVSYNPRELNRALKPCGDNIATLLITSRNSGVIAILARRRDQKEPT